MEINREELAWAAGFFDGEGCVRAAKSGKPRKDGSQYQVLRITITQAGEYAIPLLKRFKIAIGKRGKIYQRKLEPNKLPKWNLDYNDFETVQHVMCLLWSWLGPAKREQYRNAILKYHNNVRYRKPNAWNARARLELMLREKDEKKMTEEQKEEWLYELKAANTTLKQSLNCGDIK